MHKIFFTFTPSSETQGGSVGSGEKAGRKFSGTGKRAPGYRLSPNVCPKIQADAGSWLGTKNALYCAQSAKSFSWILPTRLTTPESPRMRLPASFSGSYTQDEPNFPRQTNLILQKKDFGVDKVVNFKDFSGPNKEIKSFTRT